MCIRLFWALGLSLILSFAYSQDSDCVKFKEANTKLIREKEDLSVQLNSARFNLERINSNYKDLQKVHGCCDNKSSKGNVPRDSIEACNKLCAEKLAIATRERDSLKGLIENFDKFDYTSKDSKAEKRSLNVFVLEMSIRLKDLNDEANDKISVQKKKVRFRDSTYDFGTKILFIPYKGEDSNDYMVLNDSLTNLLKRLIKLVKKYDDGAKLKLVGECNSCGSKKEIKQNSINKADNFKIHLKGTPHNLEESYFAKNLQDGVSDKKTGVSICIVRK